jgi:hypothetical protein
MSNSIGELNLPAPLDIADLCGYPMLFRNEMKNDVGGGVIQVARSWYNPSTGLSVIASIDRTQHGALLHVSLALPDKLPKWDQIKAIRNYFFPKTVDVMMVLPQERDYINVHPFAMHLWQMPMEWAIR